MKFTAIELENIFAYYGTTLLDLTATEDERNIILIWGRNGMGKTSFLNAVKVLFTGIGDERSRQVGFPPRTLTPLQYVLGDASSWIGLLNRRAAARAKSSAKPVTARVAINWKADGKSMRAERTWVSDGTTFTETLTLVDGDKRLTGQVANERLEEILPADYVGFYFFDGEDVKSLSERVDRRAVDFDRLLRLTFTSELAQELETLAKERQRKSMAGHVLDRIGHIESSLARARRARQSAEQQLAEINETIATDTIELRRLQVRRENLSAGVSEVQRSELVTRSNELKAQLQEEQAKIADDIPQYAPVLANMGLVSQALTAIEARLDASGAPETVFARRIAEHLPDWLAEIDGARSEAERAALVEGITGRIQELIEDAASESLFAGLELGRSERLRAALRRIVELGPERLGLQTARLRDTSRLKFELLQVEDALYKIEVGSQANLDEFRLVTHSIAEVEERLASFHQGKGQHELRLAEANAEITKCELELGRLERSQALVDKGQEQARYIRKIARSLNDLLLKMRTCTRQEVQDAINNRLTQLIYEHPLIHTIELDSNYAMNFLDINGNHIGRSSLSSGLKQLAATALLWAMKDVAGHPIPVIIDTPLGRIDQENQRNLLTHYYPKIAHQVIVLPTNSELDDVKRQLLLPSIAKEFVIKNELGDMATIESGSKTEAATW